MLWSTSVWSVGTMRYLKKAPKRNDCVVPSVCIKLNTPHTDANRLVVRLNVV